MSRWSRVFFLTLALLTLVRWGVAACWEVTPTEAYRMQLARHPTWCGVEGGGLGVVGTRWAAPLLAWLGSWGLFRLVQAMANERAGAWAALLLNLLPAFNLGAWTWRPEWLAAHLTVLGSYWVWQGLHKAGAWDWRWPAAGLAWGLAWLTFAGAWWVPGGLVVVVLGSRRWRGRWRRPGPWLLLGVWALVGGGPQWWWDAHHAGARWDHWREDLASQGGSWQHGWTWVTQVGVGLSPLVVAAVGWIGWKWVRRQELGDGALFFLAWVLPSLVLGGVGACWGLGNALWLVPIVPALCGLLALVWQPTSAVRDHRSRWQWAALGLAAISSVLLVHTDSLRRLGLARSYGGDVSRTALGWPESAAEIARLITQSTAAQQPLLLIVEHAELAAALDFYLPENLPLRQPTPAWPRVQVLAAPIPQSQYAFWPRYDEEPGPEDQRPGLHGQSALFVTDVTLRSGPPSSLAASFRKVRPLSVFAIRRQGSLLRQFRVFLCEDYQGSAL